MTVPLEERDDFDFTFKRDWEITEKTKNVSVRGRLNQNIGFWRNELKPSYFAENIINSGYIIPFASIPSPFYASNNKSSYVTLSLYHKLSQNYWKITVSKDSNKNHKSKFLGFEWIFKEDSTRYFQFCVLPFGLA